MMAENLFLQLSGILINGIILAIYYGFIFPAKYKISGLLVVSASLLARYIRLLYIESVPLGSILEIAVCFGALYFLYKDRLFKKIIFFIFYLLAAVIADILTYWVWNYLFGYSLDQMLFIQFPHLAGVITGSLTLITATLPMLYVWAVATKKVRLNELTYFILFIFYQVIMLFILLYASIRHLDNMLFNLALVTVFLSVLASIGVVLAMRQLNHISSENEKLSFYEKQLSIQLEHYQTLSESNAAIRNIQHDIKNHLQTIYALLDKKDIWEAKEYTDELAQLMERSAMVQFCDNLIIDAHLHNKYSLAESRKIKMELMVQLGNDTRISDLHLCGIFSNLIDNAIEACSNISVSGASPFITVKCYEKAGFLFITVRNSKQNDIALSPQKSLLTSKVNPANHGLGLKIVENIAKEYNGELQLSYSDHEFEAIVALELGSAGGEAIAN